MFNNLIESSSHAQEYKRRGSFLLFTTGVYAVLLLLAGVASIYAYDAHLEAQTTELELLTFVPPPAVEPDPVIADPVRTTANNPRTTAVPTRIELIDSVSNPNNVPVDVGVRASAVPPAPPGAVISNINSDPPAPSAARGVPTGNGGNVVTITDPPPPPPPPPPTPAPPRIIKISHIMNSEAKYLPKPNYPPMAKQIRVQGTVTVQILIDETGKVVSAKAISGHPLLVVEAQRAAMGARFSPTMIGEQPVKVSGVITYNFVMP